VSDRYIVVLVPAILLLGAAITVLSGAWAATARLIPRPVRILTGRQPRWVLWVAFLLGLFLMAFSLGALLRS
jgi:hypothetical protein